ncbi:MAG: glycosyltransferase family 9 protein [Gammaproteobacteria bacterium]|nr:glycosyltransferase family 9 protein [Gammaproteobacteria bacterium]
MNSQSPIKKVLVVRNDKLGDFMLIYPALAALKKSGNNIHITVLVPQYTSEMAKACSWVDEIIVDPGSKASLSKQYNLLRELKKQQFDAIITLYSTTRIGFLAFLAGIKYRLAPATKIAQIFYNHRLTQRRSRSLKPEFEYNVDVTRQFLSDFYLKSDASIKPPFLKFQTEEINILRDKFFKNYGIPENTKLIFVHPGTGGSANNLTIEQYAKLLNELKLGKDYYFVITAGPDEIEYAQSLSKMLINIPHMVFHSTRGLINFAKHIQFCTLFISGSTGPLHIAGALDRPTAAFYQRLRSATPLRWQTLNSSINRLAFTPPDSANETEMQKIDTTKAAQKITKFYFKAQN